MVATISDDEIRWAVKEEGPRIVTGDMVMKVNTVLRPDGSEKTVEQALVTPKGLAKLAKLLGPGLHLAA